MSRLSDSSQTKRQVPNNALYGMWLDPFGGVKLALWLEDRPS